LTPPRATTINKLVAYSSAFRFLLSQVQLVSPAVYISTCKLQRLQPGTAAAQNTNVSLSIIEHYCTSSVANDTFVSYCAG
jgi:hypothetical protein